MEFWKAVSIFFVRDDCGLQTSASESGWERCGVSVHPGPGPVLSRFLPDEMPLNLALRQPIPLRFQILPARRFPDLLNLRIARDVPAAPIERQRERIDGVEAIQD